MNSTDVGSDRKLNYLRVIDDVNAFLYCFSILRVFEEQERERERDKMMVLIGAGLMPNKSSERGLLGFFSKVDRSGVDKSPLPR